MAWRELLDQLAHANRPDRLYAIQSNKDYGFYAGRLPDGRQALAGLDVRHTLLVVLFSRQGDFIGVERRKLAGVLKQPGDGFFDVDDAELHEYLRAEFGFEPAIIKVKRFAIPEKGLAIEPLPTHYREYCNDPDSFTEEDRQEYPNGIMRWIKAGDFVLWWGNDYYLDRTGEVTSS